jgi:hypothetical protein
MENARYTQPLTTSSQAKKKCQWRAIASHGKLGIVIHDGKPFATCLPRSVDKPSTPLVSKV